MNGPGCRNPGPLLESGRVGGTQDCRTGPDRLFHGLPETGIANPYFGDEFYRLRCVFRLVANPARLW